MALEKDLQRAFDRRRLGKDDHITGEIAGSISKSIQLVRPAMAAPTTGALSMVKNR